MYEKILDVYLGAWYDVGQIREKRVVGSRSICFYRLFMVSRMGSMPKDAKGRMGI